MGGTLGPVVNHLLVPFVQEGADELVTRIVIAVTGDETVRVRRRNPLLLALAGIWNVIGAGLRALIGLFSRRSSESNS
jgi:hypothetical protein